MKNLKYWLWFTQTIGYCTVRAKQITQMYDNSIEEFYNGGEQEWIFSGLFSSSEIDKLRKFKLKDTEKIIQRCSYFGYEMITLDDSNYPLCLKEIDDPPAVLYIWGRLPDIDDRLSIAVIGTRRSSKYGKSCSYNFGNKLASVGVTVVSGGALGVDCASHYGAIAADGVTICVLGCGINYEYLMENEKMRRDITRKGAVISEYPPDTESYGFHFPQRNRIISALSDGILLIEAGKKSGSLITVNLGIEQDPKKKIFALAGTNDPRFDGSNELIKLGIASLVTDYTDIIDSFDNLYVTSELEPAHMPADEVIDIIPIKGKIPDKIDNFSVYNLSELPVHQDASKLNELEKQVYYAIDSEPVHADKICEITGLPISRVLSAITMLEIRGYVVSVPGRKYRLK